MRLQILNEIFAIRKLERLDASLLDAAWLFLGKTDREISVVCPVSHAPANALARSDGWRAFRVAGELDFGLTGILAELSAVLAVANIPIFAVSTFDTDYILVREERFAEAQSALSRAGHTLEPASRRAPEAGAVTSPWPDDPDEGGDLC